MGRHRSSAASWGFIVVAASMLTGCPVVDLGDTPSDIGLCNPPGGIDYFTAEIWPNFVRPTNATVGCTKPGSCHSEAGGNGLAFRTNPLDMAFNYRQSQLYLNCGQPSASDLLTRPRAGIDPHGGGDLIQPGDAAELVFLGWFM